jgi:hypothetical protein
MRSLEQIKKENELRQQHTCTQTMSSMNCRACNAGVPYPHQSVDEMIEQMAKVRESATSVLERQIEDRTVARVVAWMDQELHADRPGMRRRLLAGEWRTHHIVPRGNIDELIAKSSIGAGLADIKARGIDAHLVDLERETKPKRRGGRTRDELNADPYRLQRKKK